MKKLKKMLFSISILSITLIQFISFKPKAIEDSLNIAPRRPVNAAVLIYSSDDIFMSLIQKSLENIQKANEGKVQFTFFDGKGNSAIQIENINKSIQGDFDLIVLNMAESRKEIVEEAFRRYKQKGVPILLLASSIPESSTLDTYNKAFILSVNPLEVGTIQGKLISEKWKEDKSSMDRNKDNVLQYIMLQGRRGSIYADARTKASVEAIKNSGIRTQELTSVQANWDKELARDEVYSLFLRYGNDIETIIANNDAMAIGAIEALQKYGYNTGNKSKYIPVFGIDAIPEARDLIKKGYMAGSVFQNPDEIGNAIYVIGQNLALDKMPTQDTNYQINGKEIIIPLTYETYTADSG